MMLSFTKMQGLGNDFIFIAQKDNPHLSPAAFPALAKELSRRRFAVGADGIAYLSPCAQADFAMDIFNADGSAAPICGNALRCAGVYFCRHVKSAPPFFTVLTGAGLRRVYLCGADGITADMARAEFAPPLIPLTAGTPAVFDGNYLGVRLRVHAVNVGNPHAVVFTQHAESADLAALGSAICADGRFLQGVNAEFVKVVSPDVLRVRVFERGCGITLGCGSGACAAVAAAVRCGRCAVGHTVTVKLDGGEAKVLCAADGRLFLSGPACCVFDGTAELDDAKFKNTTE